MQSRWTKHLKSKEEKELFKQRLLANSGIMQVMADLIQEDLDKSLNAMRKEDNYTLPAWSEHTAHQLGIQQEADKLLKLIKSLDPKEK